MHHRKPGRRSRPQHNFLRIEDLEARRMLSITPGDLSDTQLVEQLVRNDFHGLDGLGKDGPLARIGGDLTRLYNEFKVHTERHPGDAFVPSNPSWTVKGEMVLVDAVTYGNMNTFRQQLAGIGGQVTANAERLVTVSLPITALDDLAALSGLEFARPTYRPVTRAGAVNSQGDAAMQADVGRSQFGVDGTGISVGVLSDSYNQDTSGITAAQDIASGDLPANIQVLAEGDPGDSDEGRAMLQIIHDVAPGASLLFATAGGGEAAFAQNIRRLAAAGADVIVDDIGYLTEPYFQDGLISQAVNEVYQQGIAFFSAAGNEGDRAYEAAFVDSGQDLTVTANNQDFNLGRMHDFDPGPGVATSQRITIEPGGFFQAGLQWDAPFGSLGGAGAQTDLDIFLLDPATGEIVAFSVDVNFGADAFEMLTYDNFSDSTEFSLVIVAYPRNEQTGITPADLPSQIKYIDFGYGVEISTFATNTGASWGHPMAAGAAGVAAASFFMTPEFGTTPPQLNDYSSGGGTAYYFDAAGNRLTQPEMRNQPRFTGPDNANTTFFGSDISSNQGNDTDTHPNFAGTSAAAPHVAAVAALMLELAGGPKSLTPDQIYSTLENTATDITLRRNDAVFPGGSPIAIPDGVGYDFFSGHGLVNAQAALDAIPAVVRAVPDFAYTLTNVPVAINIFANDKPGDSGSPLVPTSLTITTPPAFGTITLNPLSGIVTYTPNKDFAGTDTFRYTVTDASGKVSTPGLVTIRVNSLPVATDDSVTTNTDETVIINILSNDFDTTPEGSINPTTVTILSPPRNGDYEIDPVTGAVTYTPDAGYFGNDFFTYVVYDNDGAASNVATVRILVNAPPLAFDDVVTTPRNTPVNIGVLDNDIDPTPGGGLATTTVAIVDQPTNGTVSINGTTGVVTYTPTTGFNGTDTFTYTVTDIHGGVSNEATVTILVNTAPVAISDFINTPMNVPAAIEVTANDYDSDGTIDPSTIDIIKAPDNGSYSVSSGGVINYTPNAGFVGGDTIRYRVRDDQGTFSNIATVTFRVGALHSLSGKVFVDLNGDGIQNANDVPLAGVTIYLDKTDGAYTYRDVYVTEADGSYLFTELVTGTYDLTELHPGYFNDRLEVAGTPAPAQVLNDRFVGIYLNGGTSGSGFNFVEGTVTSAFAAAFMNRQAFFSTGGGLNFSSLDLGKSDAWVAFDGGITGKLQAHANAMGGTATLTLYDKNMRQVAKSTNGTSLLNYDGNGAEPLFLKVSGTSRNVSLSTFIIEPQVAAPPARNWQNISRPHDVDGNGRVELRDILVTIDAINRYGIGSLAERSLPTSSYVDVNGDGYFSPADILALIDTVNRQGRGQSSGVLSSTETSDDLAASVAASTGGSSQADIAFALAVDSVLDDLGDESFNSKRRLW